MVCGDKDRPNSVKRSDVSGNRLNGHLVKKRLKIKTPSPYSIV